MFAAAAADHDRELAFVVDLAAHRRARQRTGSYGPTTHSGSLVKTIGHWSSAGRLARKTLSASSAAWVR
jgi:hypothetical protein